VRSLITCGDDDGPFLVEHVGTCGRRRRRKPRRQSSLRVEHAGPDNTGHVGALALCGGASVRTL